MKHLKYIIKSKDGNSTYISGVLLLFFLLIVTFSVMFVISQQAVIKNILSSSQSTLDAYVNETSVEIYNSVKSSHDFTDSFQTDKYKRLLKDELNLNENLEAYDEHGNLKYRISDVSLKWKGENNLKIGAQIHLYIPIYFMRSKVYAIEGNYEISSHFNFK